MKRLFNIFFTIIILFFSVFVSEKLSQAYSFGLSPQAVMGEYSIDHSANIALANNYSETVLASANTRGFEISSLQDRKNNNNFSGSDKSNIQTKSFQQFFVLNYKNSIYSISHKISSYLKNEICTRAP